MKNAFKAYYLADIKEIMKREDTIFVFDTNVLLNLYSYTEQTREDFFSLLDIVKDRVWIPYHVGLEYQRNRLSVIKNEKKIFNDLNTYVSNIKKDLNANTNLLQSLKLKQRLPKINEETINLQKKIAEELDNYSKLINEWNKKQPCVRSVDLIRNRIDEIFNNKIGEIPENQEYLDELYKRGKERFDKKIPPGYEDEKTKKDHSSFKYNTLEYIPMYGDYIIWEQLINEVKNKDLKSLLFITDDVKEDWLYLIDSNGKKEIGPRVELVDEILEKTEIELFHIMKSSDFLINGKEYINNKIKDDSIDEVNENFDIKQNYYLDNLILNDFSENLKLKNHRTTADTWIETLKKGNLEYPSAIQDAVTEVLKNRNLEHPKTTADTWIETLKNRNLEYPSAIQDAWTEALIDRNLKYPKSIQDALTETLKNRNLEYPSAIQDAWTEALIDRNLKYPKSIQDALTEVLKNRNIEHLKTTADTWIETLKKGNLESPKIDYQEIVERLEKNE